MHFSDYKPLVFTSGYSTAEHIPGQKIADVKAAIDYDTGEVRYFRVTIGASANEHNFLTFEEAMLFCDINNYWIRSTELWRNPNVGMLKIWADNRVKLEDGRDVRFMT